jgi:hypothetical protein
LLQASAMGGTSALGATSPGCNYACALHFTPETNRTLVAAEPIPIYMLAYSTVAELRLRLRGVKLSRGSVRRNCLTFLQVTLKTLLKHYPDARLAVDAQKLEVQTLGTLSHPAAQREYSAHRCTARRSLIARQLRFASDPPRAWCAHTHTKSSAAGDWARVIGLLCRIFQRSAASPWQACLIPLRRSLFNASTCMLFTTPCNVATPSQACAENGAFVRNCQRHEQAGSGLGFT